MFAMGYVCMCASVLYMSICAQDSIYVTMYIVSVVYVCICVCAQCFEKEYNEQVHLHKNALRAQVCTFMYMYAL